MQLRIFSIRILAPVAAAALTLTVSVTSARTAPRLARQVQANTTDGRGEVLRATKGQVIRLGDSSVPIHYNGGAALAWTRASSSGSRSNASAIVPGTVISIVVDSRNGFGHELTRVDDRWFGQSRSSSGLSWS